MRNTKFLDTDQLLKEVREGRENVLELLYDHFMEDFLSWAGRRFKGNRTDFEDAWQDAVIVFYENVMSGKLEVLNCSIRTYLFAVGYKRLHKNNRKMKRIFWSDNIDDVLRNDHQLSIFEWDEPWLEEKEYLMAAIEKLPKQCQNLLVRRYFDEKKLDEIVAEFHFATLNVASASLSRCLKKLKETIAEMIKKR